MMLHYVLVSWQQVIDVEVLSDREDSVVDRPFVPPDFEHLVDSTHVLEGDVVDIVAALLKPSELNERWKLVDRLPRQRFKWSSSDPPRLLMARRTLIVLNTLCPPSLKWSENVSSYMVGVIVARAEEEGELVDKAITSVEFLRWATRAQQFFDKCKVTGVPEAAEILRSLLGHRASTRAGSDTDMFQLFAYSTGLGGIGVGHFRLLGGIYSFQDRGDKAAGRSNMCVACSTAHAVGVSPEDLLSTIDKEFIAQKRVGSID